jgi:hypothetical protein
MRCLSCGATNPETASWCSQCYAAFETAEAPSAPETAEPRSAPVETEGRSAPEPEVPPGPPAASGFRRRDDVLEWQCPLCDAYTSIEQLTCHACGTPLAARYARDEPAVEPNWSAALALAVVVPGAGSRANDVHLRPDRWRGTPGSRPPCSSTGVRPASDAVVATLRPSVAMCATPPPPGGLRGALRPSRPHCRPARAVALRRCRPWRRHTAGGTDFGAGSVACGRRRVR